MATIKTRVATLEKKSAAPLCDTSPRFWSDAHTCWVENHGGFILPVPLPEDEWTEKAEKQQRQLTTSFAKTGNVTIS